MKLSIDLSELGTLALEGSKLVLTPEAENAILKLAKMKHKIEQAEKYIKEKIAADGLHLDPNFTSIQSDKVKGSYRVYGSKYGIDKSKIEELPEAMYKKSVTYSAVAPEIDKHMTEHKTLPVGIYITPRAKQISLRIIDGTIDEA